MSLLCAIPFFASIFGVLPIALLWGYAREPDVRALWPAMRVVRDRFTLRGDGPFRAATLHEEHVDREIAAGVPWSILVFAGPSAMQVFMWLLAALLSVRELVMALWDGHIAWPLLSSLAFSLVRATTGATSAFGAVHRQTRAFVPGVAATLVMDLALYFLAIPLSDSRVADRSMALVGLALQGPLALAFAWAVWRRRGGRVIEVPVQLPQPEPGPVTYGEASDDP